MKPQLPRWSPGPLPSPPGHFRSPVLRPPVPLLLPESSKSHTEFHLQLTAGRSPSGITAKSVCPPDAWHQGIQPGFWKPTGLAAHTSLCLRTAPRHPHSSAIFMDTNINFTWDAFFWYNVSGNRHIGHSWHWQRAHTALSSLSCRKVMTR